MFSQLLLLASPLLGAAMADPTPPSLTYLYTANVTLGTTIDMGITPYGHRKAIPIIGGTFSGPKMNGRSSIHKNSQFLS